MVNRRDDNPATGALRSPTRSRLRSLRGVLPRVPASRSIVMNDYFWVASYIQQRAAQCQADAARSRLILESAPPGRSLRAGLASALRALAARLDEQPRAAGEYSLAAAR